MLNLEFEEIKTVSSHEIDRAPNMHRAKLPTGWLVVSRRGMVFVEDPGHRWLDDELDPQRGRSAGGQGGGQ